eukprot:jgi/Hompol1/3707/HPOL_006722-RA
MIPVWDIDKLPHDYPALKNIKDLPADHANRVAIQEKIYNLRSILPGLSMLEELLISPAIVLMSVYRVKGGGLHHQGHVASFR